MQGFLKTSTLAAALLLCGASPARAYLDPGAGSYVFQMILASVVAALYVLKVYWRQLWSNPSGQKAGHEPEDDQRA